MDFPLWFRLRYNGDVEVEVNARTLQLNRQWALFDRQEYERALQDTQAVLANLQGGDLQDAHRLLGLCYHFQGQYGQAVHWLQKAVQGSEDSKDWLNLALAATMNGDLELGEQAFEQVRLCQEVSRFRQEPGLFLQVYWYASALADGQRWTRVRPLLDELVGAYKRLYSTEPAYVYSRGMPFLYSVLELATRYFRELGQHAQGVAWLQGLASGLDENGQHQVSKAMGDLREA